MRSSSHTSTLTPLHDALRLIWPPLPTTSTGTTFYYLSPDMQTMPPEMLPYNEDTLLQFIPEGCLQDDTRHSSSSSSSQLCRGLTSNMWLGQAGGVSAAVHYDLQHNIFLQASGSKRFTLLPPSTHHLLRLHPRWHGSQRQSQGSEDTSWPAAISTETFVLQVELNEGDALYIPPLWFHLVESIQGGVAANFWTDSLVSDTWLQVTNRTTAEEAMTTGDWSMLLQQQQSGGGGMESEQFVLLQARDVVHHLLLLTRVDSKSLIETVAARRSEGDLLDDIVLDDQRVVAAENAGEIYRGRVATACKDAAVTTVLLDDNVRTTLSEYARALNALDAGSKSLLVAEWIDEFSSFAMSTIGLKRSDNRIFVEECLMYMCNVPR